PNNLDAYTDLSRYYLTPELLLRETVAGAPLKSFLNTLISSLASGNTPGSSEELLYDLTTMLVQENLPLISSYYQLQTARIATRKELFARLLKGKEFLDDHIFQTVEMKQVAQACYLSEFRFYRLFKQAFGISPYQYLLNNRIEKSLELKKLNLSWTEIALLLNFSDLAAFSNAFKKIKGVFPNNFSLQ
ncbi:MAG TPA: AraC family transcriptional regulator, partial [Daejeonella sp.]|nr:AraC family transcriptional regulator [Daejeonella sp.]